MGGELAGGLVSGGFGTLQMLMQQKADEEKRKKEGEIASLQRQAEARQGLTSGQTSAFQQLMGSYGRIA